jgi:hypothetical protein
MASSDDDELSPKKALPDFATRKCDSDSVASGDLSDGWDAEEEQVMDALAAQMAADATLDAAVLNETIKETHEWLNFLDDCPSNPVVSVKDGNDGREPTPPSADEFETIRININKRKTTAKVLAEIVVFFGLPPIGSRKKMYEKLCDSEHVVKLDDDVFEYCHPVIAGKKLPTWIVLTPELVPPIPGINILWPNE